MRRFFVEPIAPDARRVLLDPDQSRHLARVLRLRPGAPVELFDGSGALYAGTVETVGERVAVAGLSRQEPTPERGAALVVCQGLLKGAKMDDLVEKCTELGVRRFVPFTASRSQGRQDAERRLRRLRRWRSRVRAACKQCGRLRLMEVDGQRDFAAALQPETAEPAVRLFFWEEAAEPRLADLDLRDSVAAVCLMFGPEGGFSAAEAEAAADAGWLPVSLGERILRAETATVAAVAVIQHVLGGM